jgi:mannosyl-oligosaccharide alpha-1,3-glucosidase
LLHLSALPSGALCTHINEDYSISTQSYRRFHVPDVLLPDIEAYTPHLPEPNTASGASTIALSSGLKVIVEHDMFELLQESKL